MGAPRYFVGKADRMTPEQVQELIRRERIIGCERRMQEANEAIRQAWVQIAHASRDYEEARAELEKLGLVEQ